MSKAAALYKKFNFKPSTRLKSVEINISKNLVDMGPCIAVVYASMKEGRLKHYEHKFKSAVRCYSTEDGRTLIIAGGNLKVTDWIRG